MGPRELGSRQHPQLFIQEAAQFLVGPQRGGLLPGSGEREHEPGARLLVQRLAGAEVGQLTQRPVRAAGLLSQVRVLQHGHRARPADLEDRRVAAQDVHVAHRLAAPQAEGQLECVAGSLGLAGCGRVVRVADQLPERQQVELILGDLQPVAGATGHQQPPRIAR